MRVAIIGGSGRMGRWFADFLLKDGKEVIITGRNQKRLLEAKQQLGEVEVTANNVEAVKNADAVLVSVPLDKFEEVVEQFSPYTHSGQVIIEITSVKVVPVEVMHRHIKAGVILGVHPMFGPGAKSVANQNFVLTPTNEDERALAQKVRQYLEASMMAFKEANRSNDIYGRMQSESHKLTDDEIRKLAKYYGTVDLPE